MTATSRHRRIAAAASAVLLGAGGALLAVQPAAAADYQVTTLADSGPGSLRQAIEDANASAGSDTVTFQTGLTGTIELLSTITIEEGLTIAGPGPDVITITRDGAFDLLTASAIAGSVTVSGLAFVGSDGEGRALSLDGVDGAVTVSDATFTGLRHDGDPGGAVRIDDILGDVSLSDLTATQNSAPYGGAFALGESTGISGDIVLDAVEAFENEAGESGGGVTFGDVEGSVTVRDSAFTDNDAVGSFGGGIRFVNVEANVTVTDTVIEGNVSGGEGGGVQFEFADGVVLFERVEFRNNTSEYGGGLYIYDSLIRESEGDSFTVVDSQFTGNVGTYGGGLGRGGGESATPADGAQLVIDSSSFWDNTIVPDGDDGYGVSIDAGPLFDGQSVTIVNSTFREHSELDPSPYTITVVDQGDALLDLLHSTIVGPGGVALFANSDAETAVRVSHDIIESTTDDEALTWAGFGAAGTDLSATRGTVAERVRDFSASAGPLLQDALFTLEWSVVSTGVNGDYVELGPGNQLLTDPSLGALQDNGGATPTMLPSETSPAVNSGDPAVSGEPEFDQRGSGFPRVFDVIDIGAVETDVEPTLAATGGTANPALVATAIAVLLLGVGILVFVAIRRRGAQR